MARTGWQKRFRYIRRTYAYSCIHLLRHSFSNAGFALGLLESTSRGVFGRVSWSKSGNIAHYRSRLKNVFLSSKKYIYMSILFGEHIVYSSTFVFFAVNYVSHMHQYHHFQNPSIHSKTSGKGASAIARDMSLESGSSTTWPRCFCCVNWAATDVLGTQDIPSFEARHGTC